MGKNKFKDKATLEINEDYFNEHYKPLKNHLDDNASFDGCMYETFGKELEHVISKIDSNCVWTWVEGDDGEFVVCAGYHLVNRLGYLITEKPFDDDGEWFEDDLD